MILESIHGAENVKRLSLSEQKALAKELRRFILEKTSMHGGHLASNLGVVELTIALFHSLNLPQDKLCHYRDYCGQNRIEVNPCKGQGTYNLGIRHSDKFLWENGGRYLHCLSAGFKGGQYHPKKGEDGYAKTGK